MPSRSYDALSKRLASMQKRLRHRGPDDEGCFRDASSNMGLVQSRLAILDLSVAGHQPMVLDGGRYVIVFNGEIYNFRELRRELETCGIAFASHSDTEVILRLYQRDGRRCVQKLEGMFAFAIWDSQRRTCFLARDPLGIKPLYVWQHNGDLAFASEVRALLEADLGTRRLNSKALEGYLLYGTVQEPETLIDEIKMLPAGHWMEWVNGRSHSEMYWEMRLGEPCIGNSVLNLSGRRQSPNGGRDVKITDSAAVEVTRNALLESVRKHHISDVPVSLFLSGGADSTALLGLSKTCGFDNLQTFSISFEEAEFNEGPLASRTAQHFQTDHHDWRMEDSDGRRLIGDFLNAMDQPSNDGFNTFCVSKYAHDHGAKVVLSGLGGDELFGGYPSFNMIPKLQWLYRCASIIGPIPRQIASAAMRRSSSARNQRLGEFLRSKGNVSGAYWAMRGGFLPDEVSILLQHYGGATSTKCYRDFFEETTPEGLGSRDAIAFLETTCYMRNQLLRDSDVMSMAWGLELRVPLVDQRLVESVSWIPSAIRLAPGKKLLLDAVPEIPEWIRSQPKRGFRFPFEKWVSAQWGDIFQRLKASVPVPLNTWYRCWSLFTLEYFLRTNQVLASDGTCFGDLLDSLVIK